MPYNILTIHPHQKAIYAIPRTEIGNACFFMQHHRARRRSVAYDFLCNLVLPDGDPWPVFFYVTSSCQTAIVPLPPSGGRGAGRLGASPLLLWQAQWPGNGRAMDGQWTGNGKATAMRSKCAPAQAMTSNRQRQGNGNGNGKS